MGNTISRTNRSHTAASSKKAEKANKPHKNDAKTPAKPVAQDTFESSKPSEGLPPAISAEEAAKQRETARAKATVEFGSGWTENQKGTLKAGEALTIIYDPNRANQRSTHNGYPSWGVDAYVKFSPGDKVVRMPAMTFESRLGTPTSNPLSMPVTVDIPKGTTEVQVWFRNWSANNGSPSESYDSNFGENYRFQVQN